MQSSLRSEGLRTGDVYLSAALCFGAIAIGASLYLGLIEGARIIAARGLDEVRPGQNPSVADEEDDEYVPDEVKLGQNPLVADPEDDEYVPFMTPDKVR
jgi:hypothetical protein